MGEKTEKATPKKMRDARKKGQVAKSQDLPAAFTFIVSIAVILISANFLYHQMGDFLVGVFKAIPQGNLLNSIQSLFYEGGMVVFTSSMPILIAVSFVGVVVTFLTVGPVFSTEVFKFDIKKFDPIQNLKSKFKIATLVELCKSILKISIASYLIYRVMYNSLPVLIMAVNVPISGALLLFHAFLLEVVAKVGFFFIIVAVMDFAFQKYNFGKEMMMEKFEVKQEYKNTEGDPHIKGKRKQIAQEIAYQDGPSGGVRRAKAVVTNPTHLAIAIGYDRDFDAAPYIIAMGEGNLAEQIINLAARYDIPVVRNIGLARKLWDEGDVNEFVPEATYKAIAQILRWLTSLQEGENTPYVAEFEEQ